MGMQTSFPVFDADQVLTNTHLNDLRKYLDEQNRLTRAKLIGAGIVCGLQVTAGATSIKISKGCGLTSQGYLVTICDTEFTHYIPYQPTELPEDIDFISQCGDANPGSVPFYKTGFGEGLLQLVTKDGFGQLTDSTRSTAGTLADLATRDLDTMAVVLFLEAEQLKLKNCDTNDCNDKGSRMDFEPKVLLVKKSLLDEISKTKQGQRNPLTHVSLGRYNVPVQNLLTSSAVLAAFATITNDNIINKLDDALNRCYKHYDYLLEESAGNPFGGTGNKLKSIRQKIISSNPLFIQYFYDFLDDLIKAYNEFRDKAASVSSECCMNEMRFPLHLRLGEATVSTPPGNAALYREYFIYAPLLDAQSRKLEEVRMLFTRLKLMVMNFSPDDPSQFLKREIKLTPSTTGKAYLSHRCIPYYYDVTGNGNGSTLYQSWDYKKARRGESDYNLSYKADEYADPGNSEVRDPLLYDIEPYDFFRVEGHIGKPVDDALAEIISIKQNFNLPIEPIALSADYIGAILKGEEPQCVIQDLESDYRIIIAEFMCKLHDAFCSIYSFEFKPKPAVIVSPFSGVRTPPSASAKAAPKKAAANADLPAADTKEDDDEVNELVSKINFAGLKIDHPVLSRMVGEAHITKVYTKGSSLLRICGVKKGTVGDIYLSNISNNRFVNPVSLNSNIRAVSLYFRFFELIDSIESMFKILLTNELSELDMAEFKIAYTRYEKEVNNLSKQLRVITDKVQVFLSTCITEKLEALKDEYRRRMNQYILARKFNNYFKQHGGLEHKAGVPKGGTFILVYYEEIKNRRFDVSALFVNKALGKLMLAKHPDLLQKDLADAEVKIATDELETAVALQCPEQYTYFNNAVKDFLDKDTAIPAASRQALLAAIRKPPQRQGFQLRNGTVIADFYVPYICCSDCPPVSYVLQAAEPRPLVVSAGAPLCNADGSKYTAKINVSGGTAPYSFSINNVSQPGDTIEFRSGSGDTRVLVTDATGATAEAIVKGHTCPAPCLLPCGGASTACNYVLWVAQPEGELGHKPGGAKLTLTDEAGQTTNIDATTLFKEVFDSVQNNLNPNNFGQTFKILFDKLNGLIPPNFMDLNKRMFFYDPETRLLQIDKFDCHEMELHLQVSLKLTNLSVALDVIYNKAGATITDVRRQKIAKVPPFGCIKLNKCTGEKVVLCTESVRLSKIKGAQETFNQPFFNFSATPAGFDHWFWYFHTGVPFFTDEAKPQRIQIAAGAASPLVRVVGIKKGTGCFAILEERVQLEFIIG